MAETSAETRTSPVRPNNSAHQNQVIRIGHPEDVAVVLDKSDAIR
ncbi:hypothetical protein [Salicibibacter kimchii]|nr:hypothetical protein [Salicibibacter kimchii]